MRIAQLLSRMVPAVPHPCLRQGGEEVLPYTRNLAARALPELCRRLVAGLRTDWVGLHNVFKRHTSATLITR